MNTFIKYCRIAEFLIIPAKKNTGARVFCRNSASFQQKK